MNSVISRKALISWRSRLGHDTTLPADLAAIVDGRKVTLAEVMEHRRKRQAEILERKRHSWPIPHSAWKVWVAYYDMPLMGGWQCMIEHYRPGYNLGSAWIDRDRRYLKPVLMREFPLILPLGSEYEQWEAWKIAFATQYKRRTQDRKPLGVSYVWWDGRDSLRPVE